MAIPRLHVGRTTGRAWLLISSTRASCARLTCVNHGADNMSHPNITIQDQNDMIYICKEQATHLTKPKEIFSGDYIPWASWPVYRDAAWKYSLRSLV